MNYKEEVRALEQYIHSLQRNAPKTELTKKVLTSYKPAGNEPTK